MAWIDSLFQRMAAEGCSDLHLTSGLRPLFRKDGDVRQVEDAPEITPEQMMGILLEFTPEEARREYQACNDTDFAYALEGVGRFRCNLFMDHRGPGAVFRLIPSEILTAEQLGLPKAVIDFCHLSKGLVLVTGPTGSGKSTTLAAMIDRINETRSEHILTIEDPIEFVHETKHCLVNQREVGRHTQSFKKALRAALREDPDIVLVGEMRDLETIEIAIETAETGHLVFGTLHTTTAATTVDRIIDQFPSDRQAQIRTMLASSLKGVVAQTLCKRVGGGRVAALEIMVGTSAIASNIREGKTHQIPSLMQMGAKSGMRLLNDSLVELVAAGKVEAREAHLKSTGKDELLKALREQGIPCDLDAPVEDEPAPAVPSAARPYPTTAARPTAARPAAAGPAAARGALEEPKAPLPSRAEPQDAEDPVASGAAYVDPFDEFKQTRKR